MDNKLIHVVVQFVGGVARTRCGCYTEADKVTAFKNEATCPTCKGESWKPSTEDDERYLAELDALPDGDPTVELTDLIEALQAENEALVDALSHLLNAVAAQAAPDLMMVARRHAERALKLPLRNP